MTGTYVAIDLETTGLSPVNDRIIEIGAIKIVNGIETEHYETMVNPGIPISSRITQITGIDDSMVESAPGINEVIGEIVEFTRDYILLGHNISFDYSFLKAAAIKSGMEYERMGIDTHKLARRALPDIHSRSLEYLCRYFEITTIHHRALADAQSAALIYSKLCEISDSDKDVFPLSYKLPKQEPITWKQKAFLESLIKKYHINYDKKTEDLTKSQASREIDNILSVYGIDRRR